MSSPPGAHPQQRQNQQAAPTQQNTNVMTNMGIHQKAIIGSMKERKMQMRAIGGGPPSNQTFNDAGVLAHNRTRMTSSGVSGVPSSGQAAVHGSKQSSHTHKQ